MADSMSEVVAKAIYEGRNGHGCKPWSRLPKAHQEPYMADARAAIAAMREPTEAMISAGSDASGDWEECTLEAWRAMIDAALREERT